MNVKTKKKYINYKNSNIECVVKRCSKYIFYWVKKNDLFWVVLDRRERDKASETGLKEGGGMKIEIYSASIRDARSIRF